MKRKTTLDQLKPSESAVVLRVVGGGPVQRRLVDMGLVAGTRIGVQKLAPLGDPMEIKLKGFSLALRKSEAARIEVEVCG
ncbi:MAG: ferrous iron transport protein A [Sporomusaceae bacterium]|nr:ferrous iron transport protein A [Sporomusaceae bacterium]